MTTSLRARLGSGLLLGALAAGALSACGSADTGSSAPPVRTGVPAAAEDPASTATSEVAILAGGCFWGVEGVFEHVRGVSDVVSGYAGGTADTATYAAVSTGTTKHAESVRITFDPRVVSYGELLRIYFAVAHDPTELDRQGPDEGPQYRSTIFPTNAEQERTADAYIAQLDDADTYGTPVVTTVETGATFFPAELVHQDFMEKNPDYPYIVVNDQPKVEALEKAFPAMYRKAWA